LTWFAGSFVNAPRWSPDGKVIVFAAAHNKNQDIYSVPVDGGSVQRLTTASSREGRPSWSRDGRWIYFYSARTGVEEIWKMPAPGGGEEIQLTTGGGHESFESPDGKLLYYEDLGAKGLRSIAIENYSGPREGSPIIPEVQPGLWAVTEQGIYFVEFDDRNAASRDAVRLLWDDAGVPRLSHQIKFYDFRTHQFSPIGTIEKEIVPGPSGFCATWDGSTIAWSQIDRRESDLMMIENFR
jgi:dipeptidyl aminopeptidase/acylaminoacyl peptidase